MIHIIYDNPANTISWVNSDTGLDLSANFCIRNQLELLQEFHIVQLFLPKKLIPQ